MKKDLIFTFVTQLVVLLCGVCVYKFAAHSLGKTGFAEYALTRRTISFIQPAIVMGLGVGIPRYIALSSSGKSGRNADCYFVAGLCLLMLVAIVTTIALYAFKGFAAFLLLGSSTYSYLIPPISLMLLGMALHVSCYSYFRGNVLVTYANLIQLINIGLIPLLLFTVAEDITTLLYGTGAAWLAVSSFFLIAILYSISIKGSDIRSYLTELVKYGIQRVPGDMGIAALMTLPATMTAHLAGITEAGYVAFGISLVNMTGSAFAPIGLVLLPKTSQLLANNEFDKIRYYVHRLLKVTVAIAITGFIVFEAFAGPLITAYLGHSFSDVEHTAQILFISSIAYNIYISTRSVVDAFYVRSRNTKNIGIAFVIFFGCASTAYLYKAPYLISIAFVIAVTSLGVLTLREIRNILKLNPTEA